MTALQFPPYEFRLKNSENKTYIYDIIRKKFVVLQPEEWVRQHWIHHMIYSKGYPKSHINVEKKVTLNSINKRYDMVVFNSDGSIKILVECKAPEVQINQDTFDQIARYNLKMQAEYLIVSNGINHYFCSLNYREEMYEFIVDIPDFIA